MGPPNFDLTLAVSVILGDLEITDYPHMTVRAEYENPPFQAAVIIGLFVKADGHDPVSLRESIPARAFTGHDPFRLVIQTYGNLARKMSRSLFEIDPRIGLPLTVLFPDCPLFDPPYIEQPYKNYLSKTGSLSVKEQDVRRILRTCPFCQGIMFCVGLPNSGSTVEGGVWCGGNVGFAHPSCAPWVTPV